MMEKHFLDMIDPELHDIVLEFMDELSEEQADLFVECIVDSYEQGREDSVIDYLTLNN